MPTTPIVDAHLHLWDTATHPWYTPRLREFLTAAGKPDLADNLLLPDYLRAAAPTELAGLVHISAATAPHAYLAETRWIDAIATKSNLPMAIIATVDPTLPLPDLLAHLEEQSHSRHFRGIHVYQGLSPNTAAADAIASWLQDRDLVFDLVAHPATMLDWIDFLAGYPTLRVVLEHLGLPQGTDPDSRTAWHNALSLAAKETPWLCKLSGLGMIAPDLTWPTLSSCLEPALNLWGWRRLMFASNMPIDTLAGPYSTLLTTIDHLVASDATDQEAEFFYRTNATETYGLSPARIDDPAN
ncbi:amidohydrolase family protein [Nocardia crassostreae]|uniref:amidohydrolase family protein n=1 Tax=Nocardia crassostreae TaxID=53428 RepID=UPI0008318068|nr:amidohydrolase family protein [Nocardia crassostreae]